MAPFRKNQSPFLKAKKCHKSSTSTAEPCFYKCMKAIDKQTSAPEDSDLFPTTHWSLVVAAQDFCDPKIARFALAELCKIYWEPVYVYICSQGHQKEDAEDITQDLFASLVARDSFETLRKEKGRLRGFLLVAAKRFLINEWKKRSAMKRGGGVLPVSLELGGVESRIKKSGTNSPDALFDRQWALTLLQRTLETLRLEYESSGRSSIYEALKETITGDGSHASFASIGDTLGISEGAARVSAHRLRRRYREILNTEIESTIDEDTDAEEEIRHLFGVFNSV